MTMTMTMAVLCNAAGVACFWGHLQTGLVPHVCFTPRPRGMPPTTIPMLTLSQYISQHVVGAFLHTKLVGILLFAGPDQWRRGQHAWRTPSIQLCCCLKHLNQIPHQAQLRSMHALTWSE